MWSSIDHVVDYLPESSRRISTSCGQFSSYRRVYLRISCRIYPSNASSVWICKPQAHSNWICDKTQNAKAQMLPVSVIGYRLSPFNWRVSLMNILTLKLIQLQLTFWHFGRYAIGLNRLFQGQTF